MPKAKVQVVVNTPKKAKVVESPKAPKLPEGVFEAKAGKYRCIKKCYMGISIYKVDSIYEASDKELLPSKFFTRVKRVVEVDD